MNKMRRSLLLVILLLPAFSKSTLSYSVVKFLPGFQGPLPFYLETGYVGVGKSEDIQVFYCFVKSERHPEKDPLMFWLSGGPGCTSWSGLVYEIDPLKFEGTTHNGSLPTLVLNPFSWTQRNSRIPFAHGMALICDELYESLRITCKGEYKTTDPSSAECLSNMDAYSEIHKNLFEQDDICDCKGAYDFDIKSWHYKYNPLVSESYIRQCLEDGLAKRPYN